MKFNLRLSEAKLKGGNGMKDYFGYLVSKDGRVFGKRGFELSTTETCKGYFIVNLTLNGKITSKSVHRLVAECYLPNPDNLSDVDHINGHRWDNRVENLRWVSHGENIKISYEAGNRSAVGSSNANAKLTTGEVHEICFLLERGYSNPCIRDMGYPYNTISSIRKKRQWKHISKDYSF